VGLLSAVIDIHSHILPAVDDGPESFEVSVDMVRMALEAGTTDIVATPHANASYPYEPEVTSELIAKLQSAIGDSIKIHRGCDFHLSPENIQAALREPSRFAINGLSYLLVEFPEVTLFYGIDEVFDSLIYAGLTPIVTHPERNRHLAADLPRLRRWVEKGIPLQITAQSMLGEFGPELARWCLRMLSEGQVHFVASDAHDLINRPPRLDKARNFLVDRFDEEWADLLLNAHPRAVIEGRPLEISVLSPRRKRRRWFSFGASRSA
jgi:protein-tyrosine phosphatase